MTTVQLLSGTVLSFSIPSRFIDMSMTVLTLYYSESGKTMGSSCLFDKVLFFDSEHNEIVYNIDDFAEEGKKYYALVNTRDEDF